MRRAHRQLHRMLWPALAVAVAVLFALALALRPPPEPGNETQIAGETVR